MIDLCEIAMVFLRRGGKRLRPRLCREVYESLARGESPRGSLDNLCEAIECFHKASLIHDDIQDGDELRYGLPTVWKEYGVATAIAVGDWLVAHGYALIAGSGFTNVSAMIKATADSHVRLCEGQGEELMQLGGSPGGDRYESVCARKTGEAFALAATLGALAAGENPLPYHAWGVTFGVLFQIRDDMDDINRSDTLVALERKYQERLATIGVGPFLSSMAMDSEHDIINR